MIKTLFKIENKMNSNNNKNKNYIISLIFKMIYQIINKIQIVKNIKEINKYQLLIILMEMNNQIDFIKLCLNNLIDKIKFLKILK